MKRCLKENSQHSEHVGGQISKCVPAVLIQLDGKKTHLIWMMTTVSFPALKQPNNFAKFDSIITKPLCQEITVNSVFCCTYWKVEHTREYWK